MFNCQEDKECITPVHWNERAVTLINGMTLVMFVMPAFDRHEWCYGVQLT